jgi:outer membrane lipoprotein SlyB
MMRKWSILLVGILSTACASQPVFYPNEKYKQVGKEGAKQDVENCNRKADESLESNTGKRIGQTAGRGAAIGGAAGLISGLFSGNVGRGLVEGAAVGTGAGAAHGATQPDWVRRSFIQQCLVKKGYDVSGWG